MAIFTAAQILGTAVAGVFGAGAAQSIAVGIAVARGVGSLLLSAAVQALAPRPSIPKQEIQATINQAAGPRTRLYGQALLGGTRAFWETDGNKLYQVILMNHSPLAERLRYLVDGRPAVVDASGVVTSEPFGNSDVVLKYHDGTGNGGDWPELREAFPTLWTDDHLLTAQATVFAKFTAPGASEYSRKFQRGPNTNIQIEAQGASVLDPRNGATAYSDNAGLCIMDYIASADGFRIPVANIDLDSFSAFADLCDQPVPLKVGGAEPRYRLWGVYSLQDDPKSVLARMVLTCGADIYQTAEGKVGILGGQYSEPDVTITDADIYEFQKVDGSGSIDGFNVMKGTYTSADHNYADTEAEALENEAALLTQPEKSSEMQADMIPSHGQMRRMMKLRLNQENREWTGRLVTSLVGLKARFPKGDGFHTIRIQFADLGMDEAVQVLGHEIVAEKGEGGVIVWKCVIEVGQISADWVAWDAVAEEGTAPVVPIDPVYAATLPVPVITGIGTYEASGGKGLMFTIDDIDRPELTVSAQYQLDPGGEWVSMTVTEDDGDNRVRSAAVVLGETYNVRAKYEGGNWSVPTPILASIDVVPVPVIDTTGTYRVSTAASLFFTITDISRPDLEMEGQVEVSSGVWVAMTASDLRADASGLSYDTDYDMRARYRGGAWSSAVTVRTIAEPGSGSA